ncbi:hypothetical protein EV44_g3359 [Erysiphe necator]|uniref:BZIP domain-containing protein n=1 Tax=Uncinula necator TaxID=52586 RepID=A0A0B1PA32_UNCNE|nr:hypothetical protein EV44_g3359 [Erysiphe necator]
MEYIDTSFCDSFTTHSNLDPLHDGWSNMDISWLNFTASDDDEFVQARTENYRHGVSQIGMTGVSRQSSSASDQSHLEKSIEIPMNRKRLSNSFSNGGTVVKRRRGPNKNQKILTEEERKKKKAKALCRNAESARTCRGKRKQAEERLKSKSANMERDFHILCRTREALGQELFNLLEQARSIEDPLIMEAIEQASIRLSSSMAYGRTLKELLDKRLQKITSESMFISRANPNSSALQSLPEKAYPPTLITQSSSATVQKLNANNVTIDSYNHQVDRTEPNLNNIHLQIDFSKSRRVLSTKDSPPQNDSGMSTLATPVSIRRMSLSRDDEAVVIQNRLPGSPNPFMGDSIPQEEFQNAKLMSFVSEKTLSFLGNQLGSEQEKLDFVYSPSSLPQYNEQSSAPFESHLLMQPTPPSLNTPTFNQQTFDFPYSHSFICQTPLELSSEGCVASDLETAIAQLVKFT